MPSIEALPAYTSQLVFTSTHPRALRKLCLRTESQAPGLALIESQPLDLALLLLPHRLPDIERRLPTIQLAAAALSHATTSLQLQRARNRGVASKAFAHVDHPAPTFAEPNFQLLALFGEGFEERRGQAFDRGVPVDHDAVGVLQAGGEGGALDGEGC